MAYTGWGKDILMSKHPSPKIDQLRAMREAKFARNEQRQRGEAEIPEKPAKSAAKKPRAKKKS